MELQVEEKKVVPVDDLPPSLQKVDKKPVPVDDLPDEHQPAATPTVKATIMADGSEPKPVSEMPKAEQPSGFQLDMQALKEKKPFASQAPTPDEAALKGAIQDALVKHNPKALNDLGIETNKLKDLKLKNLQGETVALNPPDINDNLLQDKNYVKGLTDQIAAKYPQYKDDIASYVQGLNEQKDNVRQSMKQIAFKPNDPNGYYDLASAKLQTGDLDEAQKGFMTALSVADKRLQAGVEPDYQKELQNTAFKAQQGLGFVAMKQKDYPTAIQIYGDLAKTNPTPDVLSNLSYSLLQTGDIEGAGMVIQHAINKDDNNASPNALRVRGLINTAAGLVDEGIKDTKQSAINYAMQQDIPHVGESKHEQDLAATGAALMAFTDKAHEMIDAVSKGFVPELAIGHAIYEGAAGTIDGFQNIKKSYDEGGAKAATATGLATGIRVAMLAMTATNPEMQQFVSTMAKAEAILPSELLAPIMSPASTAMGINANSTHLEKSVAEIGDLIGSILIFEGAKHGGKFGYDEAVALKNKIDNNQPLSSEEAHIITDIFTHPNPETLSAIDHNIAENGKIDISQEAIDKAYTASASKIPVEEVPKSEPIDLSTDNTTPPAAEKINETVGSVEHLNEDEAKVLNQLYKKKFNKDTLTDEEQNTFKTLATRKINATRNTELNEILKPVITGMQQMIDVPESEASAYGYRDGEHEVIINKRTTQLVIRKADENGLYQPVSVTDHASLADAIKAFDDSIGKEIKDKINAKYDAKLAELNKPNEPTIAKEDKIPVAEDVVTTKPQTPETTPKEADAEKQKVKELKSKVAVATEPTGVKQEGNVEPQEVATTESNTEAPPLTSEAAEPVGEDAASEHDTSLDALNEEAKKHGYIGIKQLNSSEATNENPTPEIKKLLDAYGEHAKKVKSIKDANEVAKLNDDNFGIWGKANNVEYNDTGNIVASERNLKAAKLLHEVHTKRGDIEKADALKKAMELSRQKTNWTKESWKERFDEDLSDSEIESINKDNSEYNKQLDEALKNEPTPTPKTPPQQLLPESGKAKTEEVVAKGETQPTGEQKGAETVDITTLKKNDEFVSGGENKTKQGDTVTLPAQIKGGTERKMVYDEGEWKQQVGKELSRVGKSVQEQADAEFGQTAKPKAEVKTELKAKPETQNLINEVLQEQQPAEPASKDNPAEIPNENKQQPSNEVAATAENTTIQQQNKEVTDASKIESPVEVGKQSGGTQSVGGKGSEGVGRSNEGETSTRKSEQQQSTHSRSDAGGETEKVKLTTKEKLAAAKLELSAAIKKSRAKGNVGINNFKGAFAGFPEMLKVAKLHIQDMVEEGVLSFKEFVKRIREDLVDTEFEDATDGDLQNLYNDAIDAKPLAGDFHSAQNAVIEAKRNALGLEPIFKELKSTDEKLFDEVADIVSKDGAVDTMVNAAIKSNRFTFTAAEQLAILRERSHIDEQLNELDARAIDGENVAAERTVLVDKLNQYDQTLTNMGTVAGQVLRARQFFVDKELTQHTILQRMKADAMGKDLPPDVKQKIEDLFKERDAEKAKRIELEKQFEEAQSELAMERAANNLKKAAEQNRREQFKFKKSNRIEEINRNINSIKAALQAKKKARAGENNSGNLTSGGNIGDWLEDSPLIAKLALEHVKLGIEKADLLRDAVYNDIKDIYEGITKRDVADIISGYGKKKESNPDPDIKTLRDLRTQLRLMSGIEDVQGGELPKKSGLQRDELSPDARILRQELAKAIKDSGLDKDVNADPEKWKSAVKSAEKSLENQIHLLDEQIAQEKRIGNTPTSLVPSDEMLRLRAERDVKRKALDTILENNGTITAEKLAANKKLLETRIKELTDAIKNDTEINQSKGMTVEDDVTKEMKASLNGLKDVYDRIYHEKHPDAAAEKKLNSQIEAVQKRIDKKEQDLTTEGFIPKKRVAPDYTKNGKKVQDLAEKLRDQKVKEEKVNRDIRAAREEWRLAQRGGVETFFDELNNITREGAISGITALPKIFTSGIVNQLIQPIENIVGAAGSHLLPSNIRETANIEGKFNPAIEASAMGKLFSGATWKEAWKKYVTGGHSEDVLYGKDNHPFKVYKINVPGIGEVKFNPYVFGRFHGFLKTPSYKVAYSRALQYLTESAFKDPNNFEDVGGVKQLKPSVIEKIENDAFEEGKKHVFLQPNKVANDVRRYIREKINSKAIPAKVLGQLLQFNFQVLNVSANFFSAQMEHVPLWAHGKALLPLLQKEIRNGTEKLTPDQANYILRNFKKGNVGIGLFAMGYFMPQVFTGFTNDDQSGKIKFGEFVLPHWATHIPIFFVMQLGATMRNYVQSENKDNGFPEFKNAVNGAIAANPFAYTTSSVSRAMQSEKGLTKFAFDETLGRLEPQLLNEIGQGMDNGLSGHPTPRKADTFKDMFKAKLPIARETLPTYTYNDGLSKPAQKVLEDNAIKLDRFTPSKVDGIQGATIQGVHLPLTDEQVKAVDSEMEKIVVNEIEQRMNKKDFIQTWKKVDGKLVAQYTKGKADKLNGLTGDNLKTEIGNIKERAKEVALVKLGIATTEVMKEGYAAKNAKEKAKNMELKKNK